MKKSLIAAMAAVVVALVLIVVLVAKNNANDSSNTSDANEAGYEVEMNETADNIEYVEKNEEETETDNLFTPTFMYFISPADKDYKKELEVVEELKIEYAGKVNFDIKNIDDDPTILENFEFVNGQTPVLIMLNTKNDISDLLLQNCDKEKLKNAVENALNGGSNIEAVE